MSAEGSACEVDYCTYCENIISIAPARRSLFNVVWAECPSVLLVPTIGMITPGHLIAVSRRHVYSYAALPRSERVEALSWIQGIARRLESEFGRFVLFEHGSGESGLRGGCVAHAHVHMIPNVPNLSARIAQSLDFVPVTSSTLAEYADADYALLGDSETWRVSLSPKTPSQWIRMQAAALLGRPDEYDWALFTGEDFVAETEVRVRKALA